MEISRVRIKKDGSYIIDFMGHPYHVTKDMEMYNLVKEFDQSRVTEYEEDEHSLDLVATEVDPITKRNQLLDEADLELTKYVEQVETGMIKANKNYRLNLLKYKQALRDITKQKDYPNNIEWPKMPNSITK